MEKFLKVFFLFLIHTYRIVFSSTFGGACRFHPSCSVYAEDAFKRFKFIYAIQLTIIRLSKCRPGGDYGYDPIPDENKEKMK